MVLITRLYWIFPLYFELQKRRLQRIEDSDEDEQEQEQQQVTAGDELRWPFRNDSTASDDVAYFVFQTSSPSSTENSEDEVNELKMSWNGQLFVIALNYYPWWLAYTRTSETYIPCFGLGCFESHWSVTIYKMDNRQ